MFYLATAATVSYLYVINYNILGSWAKVPRGTVGQDSAGAADVMNGEIITTLVLKLEVVSARTVDQISEKKHVVSPVNEMWLTFYIQMHCF